MSTLQVTFDGRTLTFAPGTIVRVGRSSENDIVVNDPTVSRRHAQLSWEASGWVWHNAGQAPTFLAGQPVAQFAVGQQADVSLASPQGPVLHLASAPAQSPGPVQTELAAGAGGLGGGAGQANLAGQPPGYGDGPAAGYAAAGAAAGVAGFAGPGAGAASPSGYPGGAPPQGFAGGAAQQQEFGGQQDFGGQQQEFGGQQQEFPGAQQQNLARGTPPQGFGGQGAAQPGMPAYQGGPGYPGGPAYQGGPGYQGGPVMPGQGGIPMSQLDTGSFFQTLIPVRSWLHDRGWRQGIRLLIIPYALLPLIFLQLFSTSMSLSSPGWAYSLYVAPLWLLTFWYLIRPPQIGKLEVFIAIGIIIWTVIWLHVVTIYVNDHFANTHNIPGALVVGYNEEFTKALPVLIAAIFVLKVRKQKLDPRTWFLMGTVAGLAFGIVEQSIYTPLAIGQIHAARAISEADVGALSFAFRVFVDGFQHAVWAGVSGFFIGIAVNYRRRRIPLLLLGVSIPAILHALNDYTLTIFSTVWVGVLIQALSLVLFLGYTLSASTIERRVRRNPNFRGQSIMMERFGQPEQAASP